jgi:hypothetical protein
VTAREESRWSYGDVVIRREVLALDPIPRHGTSAVWHGEAWEWLPVVVVEDSPDQLVTYIAPGTKFGLPAGNWPSPDGKHPWHDKASWSGHGCLMVQRPGDHHAVWHFWTGPDRDFACWYINLQTAFRRTADGYDTQDLELDIVVTPEGSWTVKDQDLLADRVREGRYTAELSEWIMRLGDELAGRLEAGERWWDPRWAEWAPDPAWDVANTDRR